MQYSSYTPTKKEAEELDLYLAFMIKVLGHNLPLATDTSRALPIALVSLTLKRLSKKEKEEVRRKEEEQRLAMLKSNNLMPPLKTYTKTNLMSPCK